MSEDTKQMTEPRNYLIRKRGYWYRPNRAGYTPEIAAAGRYTRAEAEREAAIEPECMQAIPLFSVLDERARIVASVLSDHGMHVSTPLEGDLDDVERERWDACVEIARRLS